MKNIFSLLILIFSISFLYSQDCLPGEFDDNGSCTACPMGKYQDQSNQTECIPCSLGSFQDNEGAVNCKLCPEGFYQDLQGAISCKPCAAGYISPKGSTSSSDCVLANQPGSVEITGKATVGFMLRTNDAEELVVKRPDGTLGYRELATIQDGDGDDMNEKITGFGIIGDSLFIKEGSMDTMKVSIATKTYIDGIVLGVMNTFAKSNESFTSATTGTVKDIDGNVYTTVKIGSQWWMAENLRTTRYNDGMAIDSANSTNRWIDNNTNGKWCWYLGDSTTYGVPYGKLYDWFAVADTNSHNVCPSGWHIPSDDEVGGDSEWKELADFLEGNGYGHEGSGSDLGKSMASTSGWTNYGTAGTIGNNQGTNNSSGFTGLPGGYRLNVGTFHDIYDLGFFWSSSKYDMTNAWNRDLAYNNASLIKNILYKKDGFSVRCLRD